MAESVVNANLEPVVWASAVTPDRPGGEGRENSSKPVGARTERAKAGLRAAASSSEKVDAPEHQVDSFA